MVSASVMFRGVEQLHDRFGNLNVRVPCAIKHKQGSIPYNPGFSTRPLGLIGGAIRFWPTIDTAYD
jgi:hypothetical protein